MKCVLVAALLVSGTLPARTYSQTIVAAPPHTSNFDGFIVTEGDIADRPYTELGTVTVKAGKLTWVSRNPDRGTIDIKLRDKARQMGADAVLRVRYSSTGVSAMSWGGMKGEGVAVKFVARATAPAAQPQN